MKAKAEIPAFLVKHTPWTAQENPIWLASSFVIERNFEKYRFPAKIDEKQLIPLFELEKKTLCSLSDLQNLTILQAEELDAVDKEFLFEHFLCLESFQNLGKGQGFAVDNSGKIFFILNKDNHLEMHYCDFEGLWEKGFSLLSDIESEIGEKIPFAYSPNFGYLTANPANCGTGLRVSIYLHIPALIHMKQLESAISNEKEDGVLFTSMLGDIQNLAGDVLVLQNRYSLGTDEKSILRELHTAAMKFIGAEKLLRTHSKEKNLPEMMDLVSRAFGLLTHSYQLETKECLEALSLLKLGIDLGWINGVTQKTIDGLFFTCRKAHLLFHLKENKKFDVAQIPHSRAAFIHEKLSKMKLLIES